MQNSSCSNSSWQKVSHSQQHGLQYKETMFAAFVDVSQGLIQEFTKGGGTYFVKAKSEPTKAAMGKGMQEILKVDTVKSYFI